ncbi:MAG: hypothetical protein JNL70_25840 [Saprospiraceae bacterium]|nr:hypothetical protein [Saprospiraceae bacterium]
MGKIKELLMSKEEKQLQSDAARWVEITKQQQLLAKEKEDIENRLRKHVLDTGEVMFGDLIKAYEKKSQAKIVAIDEAKNSKELLQRFIDSWKTDELIGKMLITSSVSVTNLRTCCEKYKQVATSLKKHGLQIQEGQPNIEFKHV